MRKSQGITLIELLIYLTITTIVLVVMIDLVTRIAQNRSASHGQSEVTQNARFLTNRLTYAIEQASAINGSYPADSLDLIINDSPVTFSLEDEQIFYQEGVNLPLALTDQKVTVGPINSGERIFNHLINGKAQSVQIRFKIIFGQTNFSRDFETAVLIKGK